MVFGVVVSYSSLVSWILVIMAVTSSLFVTSSRADISIYNASTHRRIDGGYPCAVSRFGPSIELGGFEGWLVYASPANACDSLTPPPFNVTNPTGRWIVLIARGSCSFEKKVRMAQSVWYDMAIVHNNSSETEFFRSLDPMHAVNATGIDIPSVFVNLRVGSILKEQYQYINNATIHVDDDDPFDLNADLLIPFAVVVAICFITMISFMVCKFIRDRRRARRHRLPASSLKKIPIEKFSKGSPYETCAICLDDYIDGEKLRILPCSHAYHTKCIDPWLTRNRRVCPICKRKVFAADEVPVEGSESDSDTDNDERTPLVRTQPVTQQPYSMVRPLDYRHMRDRLRQHLHIGRSVANAAHNTRSNASISSSDSSGSQGNGNVPHLEPARVGHSINWEEEDSSPLDFSPSGSVYSFNSSTYANPSTSQLPRQSDNASSSSGSAIVDTHQRERDRDRIV